MFNNLISTLLCNRIHSVISGKDELSRKRTKCADRKEYFREIHSTLWTWNGEKLLTNKKGIRIDRYINRMLNTHKLSHIILRTTNRIHKQKEAAMWQKEKYCNKPVHIHTMYPFNGTLTPKAFRSIFVFREALRTWVLATLRDSSITHVFRIKYWRIDKFIIKYMDKCLMLLIKFTKNLFLNYQSKCFKIAVTFHKNRNNNLFLQVLKSTEIFSNYST